MTDPASPLSTAIWDDLQSVLEGYVKGKVSSSAIDKLGKDAPVFSKSIKYSKEVFARYKDSWRDAIVDVAVDVVAFKAVPLPTKIKAEIITAAKVVALLGHRYEQSLKSHRALFSEDTWQDLMDSAVMVQVPAKVFVGVCQGASKTIRYALDKLGLTQENIERAARVSFDAFAKHNPDAEEAAIWGKLMPSAVYNISKKPLPQEPLDHDKKIDASVKRVIQEGKKTADDPVLSKELDAAMQQEIDLMTQWLSNYKSVEARKRYRDDLLSMKEGFDQLSFGARQMNLPAVSMAAQYASFTASACLSLEALQSAATAAQLTGPMASLAGISLSALSFFVTQDSDAHDDFARYLAGQFYGLRLMIQEVFHELVATRREMRAHFHQVKDSLDAIMYRLFAFERYSKREFSSVKELVIAEFHFFEKQMRDVGDVIQMQLKELTFEPLYARIEKIASYSVASLDSPPSIETLLDDAEFLRHWIVNPPAKKMLSGTYWIEAGVGLATLRCVLERYPMSSLVGVYAQLMVKHKVQGYEKVVPHLDSLVNLQVIEMILPSYEVVVKLLFKQQHPYDPSYVIRSEIQKVIQNTRAVVSILQGSYEPLGAALCKREIFPLLDDMKKQLQSACRDRGNMLVEHATIAREKTLTNQLRTSLSALTVANEEKWKDERQEDTESDPDRLTYKGFQKTSEVLSKCKIDDTTLWFMDPITKERRALVTYIEPWARFDNLLSMSMAEGDFLLPLSKEEIYRLMKQVPVDYLQQHALQQGRLTITAYIHEPVGVVPQYHVSGAPYKSWWPDDFSLNIALRVSFSRKDEEVEDLAVAHYLLERLEKSQWAFMQFDPSTTWRYWPKKNLSIAIHDAWPARKEGGDVIALPRQSRREEVVSEEFTRVRRSIMEDLYSKPSQGATFHHKMESFDGCMQLLSRWNEFHGVERPWRQISSSDLVLDDSVKEGSLWQGDEVKHRFVFDSALCSPPQQRIIADKLLTGLDMMALDDMKKSLSLVLSARKNIASVMGSIEKDPCFKEIGGSFSAEILQEEEAIDKSCYAFEDEHKAILEEIAACDIVIWPKEKMQASYKRACSLFKMIQDFAQKVEPYKKNIEKQSKAAPALQGRIADLEKEVASLRGAQENLGREVAHLRDDVMGALSVLQLQLSRFFEAQAK